MADESFAPDDSAAPDEATSGFNLAEYWQVVVKRWKLVAACVVLFLGWAVLNTILTPPSYRATAVLDIEQDRGNPLDVGSATQMFFTYNPDYLPTQLRLLTSREMAERAAERLNLVADRTLNPKVSGLLKGQPARDQGRTVDDAITGAALGIQGGITVNQIKDTNLVELSYVDSNSKRAADIANAISEAYIDWTAESKYRAIGQASRYLSSQIEQLRSELETKQKELFQFGGQKNLGGTDSQIVSTLQGTDSMKNEYAAAVADRISKQARYDEARSAADSTLADAATNPLITQLRTDQAKLEREYAEKLNVFKPDWPAMRQLKTEIDKGRQHLSAVTKDAADKAREAAKTDYLTAVRREEGFTNAVREQRQQAVQFTSSSIEYNNLRVEVETKRNLLDALLKKQTEMEMISRTTGERVTPVRIVDAALRPTYRFSPSYRHNASRGLFMGIVAGLALCFFLEYLDRSLRTIEQVENFFKLPALGVIPAVGVDSTRAYGYGYGYGARRRSLKARKAAEAQGEGPTIELIPHTQPRSTVAEAYRAVRTALLLSRAGGVRSITVTSCLPREGKSVTSANLAVAFGQLGKRVLLVDADLHKPRAHEIFHVSNRAGLVSVLAENVDPSSVIVKTSIPDVYILPAGTVSPNPSGLLSSPAMTEFLARAAVTFDFVIIDTPPVLPVADAIVIGHQTDGVVLCVRGGKTAREQVRRMRDKLQRSGVRILGVLINNLEVQPGGKYGGQYSYGAYGYGEEPAGKALSGAAATPEELIDVHFHCLPGIDDGPGDWDQAVSLCRAAAAEGTATIVATPHVLREPWINDDPRKRDELVVRLNALLGGTPAVLAGCEYFFSSDAVELWERGGGGPLTGLNRSSSLLVEFSGEIDFRSVEAAFHEFSILGVTPVIAHPERSPIFSLEPERLARLAELGARVQVTAGAITGDFGSRAGAACRKFFELGLVHLVASDAHSLKARPPRLAAARESVRRKWGPEAEQGIFEANPLALIEGRPLPWVRA